MNKKALRKLDFYIEQLSSIKDIIKDLTVLQDKAFNSDNNNIAFTEDFQDEVKAIVEKYKDYIYFQKGSKDNKRYWSINLIGFSVNEMELTSWSKFWWYSEKEQKPIKLDLSIEWVIDKIETNRKKQSLKSNINPLIKDLEKVFNKITFKPVFYSERVCIGIYDKEVKITEISFYKKLNEKFDYKETLNLLINRIYEEMEKMVKDNFSDIERDKKCIKESKAKIKVINTLLTDFNITDYQPQEKQQSTTDFIENELDKITQ